MTEERDSRTALVIGEAGVEKLAKKKVAVFGLGGVGSYCAEALARAGIGSLTIVDKDRVEESNLNRQLPALYSTIGKFKTEVMRERFADLNKNCSVEIKTLFYLPENAGQIDLSAFDYIADCIDCVTAKLCLIEEANKKKIPVISAMGAGNRLDPERLRVTDISETRVCPLCRTVRRELHKRGVSGVEVVWSDEEPVKGEKVGSVSFVPSVMGLLMAGRIVRGLLK